MYLLIMSLCFLWSGINRAVVHLYNEHGIILMKKRINVFASIIFVACLFIGWVFILPPVKENIKKLQQTDNIKRLSHTSMSAFIPPNYISDNQYKIDILHYYLNLDLYPSKRLLKGDATIKGVFKNKGLDEIDLNFYDNMNISRILLTIRLFLIVYQVPGCLSRLINQFRIHFICVWFMRVVPNMKVLVLSALVKLTARVLFII